MNLSCSQFFYFSDNIEQVTTRRRKNLSKNNSEAEQTLGGANFSGVMKHGQSMCGAMWFISL